ncbi:MAG: HAMP domain-containing protein [Actinobacteria bacterium]|nr:HAMP domain-containing protein [Actinomycetota bacterium]
MFIRRIKNKISLGWQIFGIVVATVSVWALLVSTIMIPRNRSIDLEREKEYFVGMTSVFANLLIEGLKNKNYYLINRLAKNALGKEDVKYWIVFSENGKVVSDSSDQLKGEYLGDGLTNKALASGHELFQERLLNKERLIDVSFPIKDDNNSRVGTVRIGYSIEKTLGRINQKFIFIFVDNLVIGLFALVLSGVLSFALARALKNPIKALSAASKGVAKGDLTQSIDVLSVKEIEPLVESFNRMTENLMLLVGKIKETVKEVSKSASLLFSLSEQQASASVEQAASVNQITTTTEELSVTSKQIAENISWASGVFKDTLVNIEEGEKTMEKAVEAIENIRTKNQESTKGAVVLEEKIQQVTSVIEIIDSIASKTNLLALNAAIEAARAGEGGKGFAVVASEIRKLAENVIESTSEIKEIIADVQASTRASVVVIEEETRATERGMGLIFRAGDIFKSTLEQLKRLATLNDQTSLSTSQQKLANEQLVIGMREISETAEHFADSSEKIMAIVEDLNKIIKGLESEARNFNVIENTSDNQESKKELASVAF